MSISNKNCGHELCNKWTYGGATIMIMSDWVNKKGEIKTMVLSGVNKDNLAGHVGGKCDHHDGCIIYAMICELCEEGKLCFHKDRKNHKGINTGIVDKVFRDQNIKRGKGKGTCVFYTKVKQLNIRLINKRIKLHNKNTKLSSDQRELKYVDWTHLGHYRSVSNLKLTRYSKVLATLLKDLDLVDIPININNINKYIRRD